MPKSYASSNQPAPELMGTFLGFDYGWSKMGVAVGQTITCTARALTLLKMQEGVPNWQQLDALLHHWQPVGLIVGIPMNEGYEDQRMVAATKRFSNRLKARYSLPIFGVDERLTTFAAREALLEYGGAKALRRNSVDSIAAQFILETWLRAQSQS